VLIIFSFEIVGGGGGGGGGGHMPLHLSRVIILFLGFI
jgi:hypothetical protein